MPPSSLRTQGAEYLSNVHALISSLDVHAYEFLPNSSEQCGFKARTNCEASSWKLLTSAWCVL